MIHSMTAFARQQGEGSWGNATWELRSVNHRYLEISVRLPDSLSYLEPIIREQLKSRLQRGKIDIALKYIPSETETKQITVNKALVAELIKAQQTITNLTKQTAPINSFDILRWPGVISASHSDTKQWQEELLRIFAKAMDELIALRSSEGKLMRDTLLQRLSTMQLEIAKVKACLPEVLIAQREKLNKLISETKTTLDSSRLEQEMVLFAQKIDVTEELDRLQFHIHEMKKTLQHGGAVGRRLDFLLQELNREANTLASKSAATQTTTAAVELKVLIEQMREQIQNAE